MKIIIDAYKQWDKLGDEYLNGYDETLEFEICDDYVNIIIGGYVYTIDKDEFVKLAQLIDFAS